MTAPASSSRGAGRQAGTPSLLLLNNASLALFAIVLVAFSALSPKFLTSDNLLNILLQSSSTIMVATGVTFVLLTAGVDLSVGAAMFLGAAICGRLVLGGHSLALAISLISNTVCAAFVSTQL